MCLASLHITNVLSTSNLGFKRKFARVVKKTLYHLPLPKKIILTYSPGLKLTITLFNMIACVSILVLAVCKIVCHMNLVIMVSAPTFVKNKYYCLFIFYLISKQAQPNPFKLVLVIYHNCELAWGNDGCTWTHDPQIKSFTPVTVLQRDWWQVKPFARFLDAQPECF